MTKPSVTDYLAEICKEDNVDVNEYLTKHNETKTMTDISKLFKNVYPTYDSTLDSNMTYTWKNRVKSVWLAIKNIKYSAYNPLDFNTYPDDGYFYDDSTPWNRFVGFVKFQWSEIKWAWSFTPKI